MFNRLTFSKRNQNQTNEDIYINASSKGLSITQNWVWVFFNCVLVKRMIITYEFYCQFWRNPFQFQDYLIRHYFPNKSYCFGSIFLGEKERFKVCKSGPFRNDSTNVFQFYELNSNSTDDIELNKRISHIYYLQRHFISLCLYSLCGYNAKMGKFCHFILYETMQ